MIENNSCDAPFIVSHIAKSGDFFFSSLNWFRYILQSSCSFAIFIGKVFLLLAGGVEWRIYRYVAGVKVKWKWEYTYRHDNGDQQQQQRKYRFITTMLYNALNNTSIVYVPSGKGKHIVLTSRKFFICALWNSRIVVKCVIAAIKIGFYRFFIEISFWADGFFW